MPAKRKPDFPFKVCGLGKSGSKLRYHNNLSGAFFQHLTLVTFMLVYIAPWGFLDFFAMLLIGMEVM